MGPRFFDDGAPLSTRCLGDERNGDNERKMEPYETVAPVDFGLKRRYPSAASTHGIMVCPR